MTLALQASPWVTARDRKELDEMTTSLKVAMVLGEFPTVSETFVLNQIAGLLDRGHDVRIYAYRQGTLDGVHRIVEDHDLLARTTILPPCPRGRWRRRLAGLGDAVRLGGGRPEWRPCLRSWVGLKVFLDPASLTLVKDLRRWGPDIVHAQFGLLGAKLARYKRQGLLPGSLVTSFRGSDTTVGLRLDPRRYEDLFQWGDGFLAVSQFIRHRLVRHGGPAERIVVHYSGVDLSAFEYRDPKGLGQGPIRLLVVGRLVEVKAIEDAVAALGILRRQGADATLDVLGDGPLRGRCEQVADATGVGACLRLHGACPRGQVVQAMRAADVLLCPSVVAGDGAEEGMPNVVKEAMAMGLPVVATRTGGIPEIVQAERTGLLVRPHAPAELAAAARRLWSDSERTVAMTRTARRLIEEQFDLERLNDRLVEYYESCCLHQ